MRKFMTDRYRHIGNIHHIVIISFHRKGKIVPQHVLLTEKSGKSEFFRHGIISPKQRIRLSHPFHLQDPAPVKISFIDKITVFIPFKFLCQLIALPDHIIS